MDRVVRMNNVVQSRHRRLRGLWALPTDVGRISQWVGDNYSICVLTEFYVFADFPGKNGPRGKQPERFFQNHLQVFKSM